MKIFKAHKNYKVIERLTKFFMNLIHILCMRFMKNGVSY